MKHQSFDVEFRERVERWLAAPLDSIPAGSVRLLLDSHDALVAALRNLTDAIGKDGHARLNYWPQMQAAWAVLAQITEKA